MQINFMILVTFITFSIVSCEPDFQPHETKVKIVGGSQLNPDNPGLYSAVAIHLGATS